MNVLHRATKDYRQSVNTPDYPIADWIHGPDLSAVVGQPSKYWTITGDVVTLMSQAERDAVDAAEVTAAKDAVADELDRVQTIMRAFAEALLDELNLHAERTTAILNAVDGASNLATLKTAVALIADVPTRTLAQLKTAVRGKL